MSIKTEYTPISETVLEELMPSERDLTSFGSILGGNNLRIQVTRTSTSRTYKRSGEVGYIPISETVLGELTPEEIDILSFGRILGGESSSLGSTQTEHYGKINFAMKDSSGKYIEYETGQTVLYKGDLYEVVRDVWGFPPHAAPDKFRKLTGETDISIIDGGEF